MYLCNSSKSCILRILTLIIPDIYRVKKTQVMIVFGALVSDEN